MSSSLLLAATGELIPEDPKAPGVHLLAEYDLGDPESVTAAVEALLADGERVVTTRTGNRTFTLPLLVIGEDRQDLTARVDALLLDLTQATFTLTWTPDGGLPIVWDCFPGQPTIAWDQAVEDHAFAQALSVTIPALPYGRSPDLETVTLTEVVTSVNGRLYTLSDLLGSARAPLAVEMSFPLPVDSWLLHQPPPDADPAAPILNPFPDADQNVTVDDAELLRGTYSLVAGVTTYGEPGEQRTMDVTITQDGTSITQTIQKGYTSELNLRPFVMGNVTLPLVARPDGAPVSLTFTFDDSGGTLLHTLMLIDTRGRTIQSHSQPDGVDPTESAFIDEPPPGAVLGPIWNSPTLDRADGYAVAVPRLSGGPLVASVDREGSALLLYSAGIDPNDPVLTYRPRWLAERVT